jgi:hypothetical protein
MMESRKDKAIASKRIYSYTSSVKSEEVIDGKVYEVIKVSMRRSIDKS